MPAKNLDQKALFETAFREGRAAFESAITAYLDEKFYAYCFYTDNDVTSVYPTANTLAGLRRINTDDDPEENNYYKWAPAEWRLDFGQFGDRDLMAETNKLLYPTVRSNEPSDEFGERKRQTLITLTEVLRQIRETGIFAKHTVRNRIAFWVNIGDSVSGEMEWMFQPALPHLDADDIHELRRLFKFKCR